MGALDEELRRECPGTCLSPTLEFAEIPLRELAALKRRWETAAAERMRELCRLAALDVHAGLIASAGFDHPPLHVTQTVIDAIDALEPEDPDDEEPTE